MTYAFNHMGDFLILFCPPPSMAGQNPSCDLSEDPYCRHVAHLFVQLSMMVLLKLHAGQPEEEDWDALATSTLDEQMYTQKPTQQHTRKAGKRVLGRLTERQTQNRKASIQPVRRGSIAAAAALIRAAALNTTPRGGQTTPKGQPSKQMAGVEAHMRAANTQPPSGLGGVHFDEAANTHRSNTVRITALTTALPPSFSPDELRALKSASCPVTLVAHRIIRTVTTRAHATEWQAPPPIVTNIYQVLERGLGAYSSAIKMKEVPMPFAFVQVNALMLIVFNLIVPVAIANFSSTISMAMLTTMVVVGAFSAMFLVANEMEDPFGTEANHLDLRLYHAHFVGSLRDMLAFFPEDSFLAAGGDGERSEAAAESSSGPCWASKGSHPRFSYVGVHDESPQDRPKDESRTVKLAPRRVVSPSSDGETHMLSSRGVHFTNPGASKSETLVDADGGAHDEDGGTRRQTLEA